MINPPSIIQSLGRRQSRGFQMSCPATLSSRWSQVRRNERTLQLSPATRPRKLILAACNGDLNLSCHHTELMTTCVSERSWMGPLRVFPSGPVHHSGPIRSPHHVPVYPHAWTRLRDTRLSGQRTMASHFGILTLIPRPLHTLLVGIELCICPHRDCNKKYIPFEVTICPRLK